ncbi:MAG: ABC transporter permease [Thermodesulfobacteriota bacterium]|nr:ABC transporter permease [Thermodesulfobacteriota bacterium]
MVKLIAIINKELLILWRDRVGLLILFVMPAVLVLVITLVQDNTQKLMGDRNWRICLVDEDQSGLGDYIADVLQSSSRIIVNHGNNREQAWEEVKSGEFQAEIIIFKGTLEKLRKGLRHKSRIILSGEKPEFSVPIAGTEIGILFEPSVGGGFRSAITGNVRLAVMGWETETLMREVVKKLFELRAQRVGEGAWVTPGIDMSLPDLSKIGVPLIQVVEQKQGIGLLMPTAVQQNVPAWAMFGIFFIVVPLAGSLLRERQNGTLARMLVLPVSYSVLLIGKLIAFGLVCLCQFGLIVALGRWLLPLMGTDPFVFGEQYLTISVVLISVICAATSYGVLLGSVAKSYEQALMFGPISVVIAAAIGGVMVPVYAMPPLMRELSNISPLGWGLKGFLKIFVQNAEINCVLAEALLLLGFAFFCLGLARLSLERQMRAGMA